MAAYGAAVSLKNTIRDILQSSRISLVPPSPRNLKFAYSCMCLLQEDLLKLEDTGYSKIRTRVNGLDERIKEVIWEFEDILETHYTHQILPQLESSLGGERDRLSFSVDLRSLRENVCRLLERVGDLAAEYDIELRNMPDEEGEPLSSRIDFRGINSSMVGLSREFEKVRDFLIENKGNRLLVTGMAGVGKTTLVKRVFDDPSIQRHFDFRAWVKVGRKYESNETLRCILAQVYPSTHHQMFSQRDEDDNEKLLWLLKDRLKDKKCLIVLDDVWVLDTRLMGNLQEKNFQILLTSRLRIQDSPNHVIRLLNKEESKKLLGEKVFGEKGFPPYLAELGEKIAKKCEGLPLMIVTVAELLTKSNMSIAEELLNREELKESIQKYWIEVAEKQHNSVFVDAYNQISEVFFPSYDYLPQYLKMFFLYLGAFPPYRNLDPDVRHVCCISAEGFLELNGEEIKGEFMHQLGYFVCHCQDVLAKYFNLLLWNPDGLSWFSNKDFRVHSCWQHLCKKEASKIKFLHVLQSCDEVMNDPRRLCVHSNTLFAIKQVYGLIKSDCPSGFPILNLLNTSLNDLEFTALVRMSAN